MSAPTKDGANWRGLDELGPVRRGDDPITQQRRETALRRLVAWGDRDIAIILGLLPDVEIDDASA